MNILLEKKTGHFDFVHITTADRIKSILDNGILPSMFGDFVIENNDGSGVYAVLDKPDLIQKVIENHFCSEDTLVEVHFTFEGECFECVDELFDEDDFDYESEKTDASFHKGYFVIPKTKTNGFEKIDPAFISRIVQCRKLSFDEQFNIASVRAKNSIVGLKEKGLEKC